MVGLFDCLGCEHLSLKNDCVFMLRRDISVSTHLLEAVLAESGKGTDERAADNLSNSSQSGNGEDDELLGKVWSLSALRTYIEFVKAKCNPTLNAEAKYLLVCWFC